MELESRAWIGNTPYWLLGGRLSSWAGDWPHALYFGRASLIPKDRAGDDVTNGYGGPG